VNGLSRGLKHLLVLFVEQRDEGVQVRRAERPR
jgi:hypothetical protein